MKDVLNEDEKSRNLKSEKLLTRLLFSLILTMVGALFMFNALPSNTVRAQNGEHPTLPEWLDLIDPWWALASLLVLCLAVLVMSSVSGKEEKP